MSNIFFFQFLEELFIYKENIFLFFIFILCE